MLAMTALRRQAMSVDEFLAWAERQPERWELVEGIPTAMSPERVVRGDVKYRVARALDVAIARAQVRPQAPAGSRWSIAATPCPAMPWKFPIRSSSSRCCSPATP
jgi:Uma2 family endonuclease